MSVFCSFVDDKQKACCLLHFTPEILQKTSPFVVQILFARAEGLHAHGHTREACKLARRLAEEILSNPPDFTSENHHHSGKGNPGPQLCPVKHAYPVQPFEARVSLCCFV